jgi:hypothetical protein
MLETKLLLCEILGFIKDPNNWKELWVVCANKQTHKTGSIDFGIIY